MNVYKAKKEKYYRFPVMVTDPGTGARKQWVISTGTTNKRIAEEIKRKTDLLNGLVEAGLPPTTELRQWLEVVSPKIRKRLDQLGLIPKDVTLQIESISGYVEDYLRACSFRGDGANYIKVKRKQLALMFHESGVQALSQLKHDRIKPFMESLKAEDKAHRTVNMYRATVNAFSNWLVDEGVLEKHDLHRLPRLDVSQDQRHPRRPATDDEIRQLLQAAPDHRSFVYFAATMTGLRRGEMGQIERRDIDLEKQTLRVRSEVSKNGEEAVLPLHDELVATLLGKIAGLRPNDRIFHPIPDIRTFKRDLKSAGIDYQDENGRYFDFHSLRGTFATRLLRNGVFPSKAIRLTRHKSVKTLEDHYDMLGLSDAKDAMGQLPGLGAGDTKPPNGADESEYPLE
ncbi:MAG: tyrosine-type recombinase/integrase [Phycisphaeraceae bacterium]